MPSVPFFNYPALFTSQEAEFQRIFADVGRRGAFIKQRDLEDFEKCLASFLGVSHALGVGNATDGLQVALLAAGVKDGDEVILSSHTMLATAVAVHFAGAKPVPVESGPDHLIDPTAVEAAVTPRTRAIMPTQLNGRTCDMDSLGRIADKHGLLIVEDAAQALGSCFKGRCAGSFGASAAISFYPAKVLGCMGDGGAVVTNDTSVYEHASQLCNFGRNSADEVVSMGVQLPIGQPSRRDAALPIEQVRQRNVQTPPTRRPLHRTPEKRRRRSYFPRPPTRTPTTSTSFRTTKSKPKSATNSNSTSRTTVSAP